jgi:Domain of unknown function (DUF4398)
MRVRTRIFAAALFLALTGCGPIGAHGVIREAETALVRARAVGSERYAPYQTAAAELYLEKAREEQGRAQYGAAKDLARQSLDFARQAADRAGGKGSVAAPAEPATAPTSRNP